MKARVLVLTLLLAGTAFLVAPAEGSAPAPAACTAIACPSSLPCVLDVCEPVPDVVPPAEVLAPLLKRAPCRNPIGVVYQADEFDGFGSAAPSSPRPDLQAWMSTLGGTQRGFDQWGSNMRFGHTLTGLAGNVVSAKLTIHLHATSDLPGNDGIAFQMGAPGVFAWSNFIGVEAAAQGQSWPTSSPGVYTDATLTFDLGAAPHDLRASIGSAGYLDVYVQDDTVVDYIQLEIWWCKCDHVSVLLEQGTDDRFVGPEPTTPRPGLPVGPRAYDDGGADRAFATSLALPDYDCLTSGFVEIRLRLDHSLASNDWIHLQYTGSGFLQSQPVPTGLVGSIHTATIPLSPAVLQHMEQIGFFDVYVQDDTAIDHVRLVLTYSP